MRSEKYYALRMLDGLRLFIVSGWDMEKGRPPKYGDWSHVEGVRSRFSSEQQLLLASWFSDRRSENIWKAFEAMLPELLRIHGSLCEKTGLEERPELIRKMVELVM